MTSVKLEIARLRRELDQMETRFDAGEPDNPDADAEFTSWLQRNRDALNESIKEARAAVARGEYFEGTTDELLQRILLKESLQRSAS